MNMKMSMSKEQIDELYHLLRVASNEGRDVLQAFPTQQLILGLARHLLAGGDYSALIQYSAFYGEKFLLDPTFEAIHGKDWKPSRIVEFGAGLGWLGRGLAAKLNFLPTLFVDKRQWAMIDIVADLELGSGILKVDEQLREGDVIVMSDFLHCVENPEGILRAFSRYPVAALEYSPTNIDAADSYTEQLSRYGGNPIAPDVMITMLLSLGRKVDVKDLEPYILILIDKEE